MSDTEQPAFEVKDVPAQSRYEADIAGSDEQAIAAYELDGQTMTFTHTEVPEAMEGKGVGSALVHYALSDARSRGLKVVPDCPFVSAYIRRHPEFADLTQRGSGAA